MFDRTCNECGKTFQYPSHLRRHQQRKTPCALIVTQNDLSEKDRNKSHICHCCGRYYASQSSLNRHIKKFCKMALKEKLKSVAPITMPEKRGNTENCLQKQIKKCVFCLCFVSILQVLKKQMIVVLNYIFLQTTLYIVFVKNRLWILFIRSIEHIIDCSVSTTVSLNCRHIYDRTKCNVKI